MAVRSVTRDFMRPPSRFYAHGNDGFDIAIEYQAALDNRRGGHQRGLPRTLHMVVLSFCPSPTLNVVTYGQRPSLAQRGRAVVGALSERCGRERLGVYYM